MNALLVLLSQTTIAPVQERVLHPKPPRMIAEAIIEAWASRVPKEIAIGRSFIRLDLPPGDSGWSDDRAYRNGDFWLIRNHLSHWVSTMGFNSAPRHPSGKSVWWPESISVSPAARKEIAEAVYRIINHPQGVPIATENPRRKNHFQVEITFCGFPIYPTYSNQVQLDEHTALPLMVSSGPHGPIELPAPLTKAEVAQLKSTTELENISDQAFLSTSPRHWYQQYPPTLSWTTGSASGMIQDKLHPRPDWAKPGSKTLTFLTQYSARDGFDILSRIVIVDAFTGKPLSWSEGRGPAMRAGTTNSTEATGLAIGFAAVTGKSRLETLRILSKVPSAMSMPLQDQKWVTLRQGNRPFRLAHYLGKGKFQIEGWIIETDATDVQIDRLLKAKPVKFLKEPERS